MRIRKGEEMGTAAFTYNIDMTTILFLHGWQSVPGGVKPTYLKDHGHTVINPKLLDDDFQEAVRIAQQEFDRHWPQVVVGSSRGGAVAMSINSGGAKLVLLCPAWKKNGAAKTVKPGTVILHSKADDVIPFGDSEEFGHEQRVASVGLDRSWNEGGCSRNPVASRSARASNFSQRLLA
jgi:hypothetical protein